MTPEQFMHALAELVAEAEDAGLPTVVVADELDRLAQWRGAVYCRATGPGVAYSKD